MGKVAFLFSGQGAQMVGMGKSLCEQVPAAAQLFQKADEILGFSLTDLCWNGPEEKLNSTAISQPAIFVTSLAALEAFKLRSPEIVDQCVAAAGLSLGEYSALVFAGALSFEDGLRLVQKRGEAMQEASDRVSSGMVSVLGLENEKVEELCRQTLEELNDDSLVLKTANYLCPLNLVVSGSEVATTRLVQRATDAGAMKAIKLAVAGAFHTPLMAPAASALKESLAIAEFKTPRIPVISNVDAAPHSDPDEIREILLTQLTSPVQWEKSMRNLLADGVEEFYETGPGRVLRGLMKRIDRKKKTFGMEEE